MTIPARVEMPQFPGGKRIAVTTSWDDGVVEDRRVVAFLNDHGMKGTFNLNSSKLKRNGRPTPAQAGDVLDACEVAGLYAGHEAAIHTATHPRLERLDRSQIAAEVLDDRKAIEDLVGYPVRGMAYPYGTYSRRVIEVLRALGIVYARTVENSPRCFPPEEPLAWKATMHQYNTEPSPLPERWNRFYENARSQGVFFVWAHSYEFDRQNDWAGLERMYAPMAGKPDVWYCTNMELFDYEDARQRIVLAANRGSAYNPSAVTVTLSADGRLVDVPPGATVALQ